MSIYVYIYTIIYICICKEGVYVPVYLEAFYTRKSGKLEARLREAYRKSTGVNSTPAGQASVKHGVVVDKMTGKFMATYDLGKTHGSICKIFLCKEDADFWFDTMHSLMLKGRLAGNLASLRKAEATRKATAAAVEKILKPPPSRIRVYKPVLDQILLIAAEHDVEGYILAMLHSTLGWRTLTCILTGDEFTEKKVEQFMKESNLVKV